MRTLGTIQRIKSLSPIEGKERIEIAKILGWNVIVQKGQFKVNDLCCYVEIDSILPEKQEFEFLRARCYSPKWNGFRIRTMKMGGVISQGICFTLDILKTSIQKHEGDDVTDLLGIIKYDPELKTEMEYKNKKSRLNPFVNFAIRIFPFLKIFLRNKNKYNTAPWPSFIHKTDETRIQALPHILTEYAGLKCYVTEKLDGQSGSFAFYKNKFYVCSRNLHLLKPDNSNYWRIAKELEIEKKLKSLKQNICIQGEIIGPGIQGNKYKLNKLLFRLFQAFDIDKQKYFTIDELQLLTAQLRLDMVPLYDSIILEYDVNWLVDNLAKGVSAFSKVNEVILKEGVVIRSVDNKPYGVRGLGEIFSFKVINPEFLLQHEGKE